MEPAVEEDGDDLLPGLGALAEDDGFQEGGPAQIVDVVDVDGGLDDATDIVDVAAFAGGDDGDAAVSVAEVEVGVGR